MDRDGRFAARGIYNRKSEIAVLVRPEDPDVPIDEPTTMAADESEHAEAVVPPELQEGTDGSS